ncbi:hypothetical protein [Paenibacillus sp. GYB003]|uniref:hypothetical protein n=1 Tax=Paenibacillus sp. GYB003 TaxID=2994392 RepID=UPI002F965BF5
MLVRDIERALERSEQVSWRYGPELDRGAIVHLCRRIGPGDGPVTVLELGGGRSTFVWRALGELGLLNANVVTLLHDPAQADELASLVHAAETITVLRAGLKQITDHDRERLFADPVAAAGVWPTIGTDVPRESYYHYTIRNAFYDRVDLPLAERSADVLIVDGPHGNGRSLAYPLFGGKLKPDALVLIDDFDHYPFLADLGRVFRYSELYRDIVGEKRWALVKLEGAVQGGSDG